MSFITAPGFSLSSLKTTDGSQWLAAGASWIVSSGIYVASNPNGLNPVEVYSVGAWRVATGSPWDAEGRTIFGDGATVRITNTGGVSSTTYWRKLA